MLWSGPNSRIGGAVIALGAEGPPLIWVYRSSRYKAKNITLTLLLSCFIGGVNSFLVPKTIVETPWSEQLSRLTYSLPLRSGFGFSRCLHASNWAAFFVQFNSRIPRGFAVPALIFDHRKWWIGKHESYRVKYVWKGIFNSREKWESGNESNFVRKICPCLRSLPWRVWKLSWYRLDYPSRRGEKLFRQGLSQIGYPNLYWIRALVCNNSQWVRANMENC